MAWWIRVSGGTITQPTKAEEIKAHLQKLSANKGDLAKLTVIYDDLHGWHGGLTLEIHGTGAVKQRAVREKVGTVKKSVSKNDLKQLVQLLVKEQAWVQQTPDRTAEPDENAAMLTVVYGDDSTTIWEWYNDMDTNQRIVKIREFMKQIARQ